MKTMEITADRVRANTASDINQQIDIDTALNINVVKYQGEDAVRARIKALDKEWDIERVLELNAALVAFSGSLLSATVSKKWAFLPAMVTFFLAQHALQGWCPPLTLFRRMKIRTRQEIDREKDALEQLLNRSMHPAV